jgi:response regulator RpfG family c-di-GMP phosphodiesterase
MGLNTVVMVDDSSLQLRLYGQMLKSLSNVNLIPFESPILALHWCTENEPDLILVDYNMPELDGVEFVRRFRALNEKATVPVVVITGESDNAVRRNALELGADDFLTKPVDAVEFRARVKNMLRIREHGRMLADHAAWLTEEVRRATASLLDREQETIYRLTRASEHRDNETGDHIIRIGHYASALAAALDLSQDEQDLLRLATPMHDIGKVGTPDTILLKTGPLTPEEWEIMKQHAIAGYDILRDSESLLLQKGAEIALSHHERFDGGGYPFGLEGDKVPLSGRIAAVCDVFDALLSKRPYKEPWPIDQVLAHMNAQSGRHFDPNVIAAFHRVLPELLEIRARYDDINCNEPLREADGTQVA